MRHSYSTVRRRRGADLAALAVWGLAATQAGASTLWRTDWLTNEPPSLFQPTAPNPARRGIAFADNGDVLLGSSGSLGYADEFITRFGSDGTLRWNGVVHSSYLPATVVPAADGGAFATFEASLGYAARFDAEGHTVWARGVPAGSLVPIDGERVAATDCQSASVLDAATGVVRWHRLVAWNNGCEGGIVVDASTIYTIAPRQSGALYFGQRLAAFDFEGNVRWQSDADIAEDASLIGAGDLNLYLRTSDETIAVRRNDGSIAWRAPASGWILAGASREPIVDSPDGIESLDAADGHVRWTAPIGAHVDPIALIGDAIVALTSGGLSRINPETGAIAWTVQLPEQSPDGNDLHWIAMGGLASGAFSVVASTYDMRPFVQRVDLASGALAGVVDVPSITQGISGSSVREGADVVGMHLDNSNVLRMIDVNADTGGVRWTSRTPFGSSPLSGLDSYGAQTIGNSRVAVAMPLRHVNPTTPADGLVRAVAYDRASGDEAWDVVLYDNGELEPSVSTPLVDAAGNVIVPIGALGPPWGNHQAIIKLAGADGTIVWRIDNTLASSDVSPPTLIPLGDDFLMHGPFDGSSATLRRFSGVDGSVQWESDVFADTGVGNVYRIDDSRVVAIAATTGIYNWAMFDAATGAVLWRSTAACGTNATCYLVGGVGMADGNVMLPAQLGADEALARFSGDGSGTVDVWPVAETRSDLVTWLDLAGESDGVLGFVLRRSESSASSGVWYGQFDPSAGEDISLQGMSGFPLGSVDAGSLVTSATVVAASRPSGTQFSREDMTIAASGNLVAAVTLDRDEVTPGQMLNFHLTATYAGDAALTGARLRGLMAWSSGATDLACVGSGVSNCMLDATIDRNIDVTFDIAPGGSLDVTGRILVIDDFPGELRRVTGARVIGPTGLDETETADNFAEVAVVQALFASGFDGD
jgi:hypothetical protein